MIETKTRILFLDVELSPGGSYTHPIPTSYTGFVYCWRGAGLVGEEEKPLAMGQVGVLGSIGETLTVKADNSKGNPF